MHYRPSLAKPISNGFILYSHTLANSTRPMQYSSIIRSFIHCSDQDCVHCRLPEFSYVSILPARARHMIFERNYVHDGLSAGKFYTDPAFKVHRHSLAFIVSMQPAALCQDPSKYRVSEHGYGSSSKHASARLCGSAIFKV